MVGWTGEQAATSEDRTWLATGHGSPQDMASHFVWRTMHPGSTPCRIGDPADSGPGLTESGQTLLESDSRAESRAENRAGPALPLGSGPGDSATRSRDTEPDGRSRGRSRDTEPDGRSRARSRGTKLHGGNHGAQAMMSIAERSRPRSR
jgi:hypothetical protein